MAICGLVITLSQDPDQRSHAKQFLASADGLTLGEPNGQRIPAVLETGGKADYRQRWDELQAMTGVTHLDLTYVNFEDQEEAK